MDDLGVSLCVCLRSIQPAVLHSTVEIKMRYNVTSIAFLQLYPFDEINACLALTTQLNRSCRISQCHSNPRSPDILWVGFALPAQTNLSIEL